MPVERKFSSPRHIRGNRKMWQGDRRRRSAWRCCKPRASTPARRTRRPETSTALSTHQGGAGARARTRFVASGRCRGMRSTSARTTRVSPRGFDGVHRTDTLESRTGRNISSLFVGRDENNVLFVPGTRFEVVAPQEVQGSDGTVSYIRFIEEPNRNGQWPPLSIVFARRRLR